MYTQTKKEELTMDLKETTYKTLTKFVKGFLTLKKRLKTDQLL